MADEKERPKGMGTLSDVEQFVEDLKQFSYEDIATPPLRIPTWPRGVGTLELRLTGQFFFLPEETTTKKLYRMVRMWGDLRFVFQDDGEIYVTVFIRPLPWAFIPFVRDWSVVEREFRSANDEKYGSSTVHRLGALLILSRHKDVLFPMVIAQLKRDFGTHHELVLAAQKALAPFVPALIADELTK